MLIYLILTLFKKVSKKTHVKMTCRVYKNAYFGTWTISTILFS